MRDMGQSAFELPLHIESFYGHVGNNKINMKYPVRVHNKYDSILGCIIEGLPKIIKQHIDIFLIIYQVLKIHIKLISEPL